MAVPTFVDQVTLHIAAGRGGNGVASVHREKFKPLGGPDGGNGGPGGSVILRVDPDVTTLVDYHHSPQRRAEHGGHGAGAHKNGGHGSDLVLPVPDGTVVSDSRGQRHRRPGRPGHRADHRRGRPRRARQRGAGLGQAQGPGLRAARRARRRARHRARAEGGRRRRPGRLPERRQVQRDRGDLPGPAQDRRLPVHHAGAQPRRGLRRRHDVHRRRRARPDRGRQRGTRARPRVPAPHRAVRGAGARPRHRDPGARPQPVRRPRRDRGRAVPLRRARGPARAWSRSTRSTSPTVAASPTWSSTTSATRGFRVFPVSAASGEGLRELRFAMAEIVQAARAERQVEVAQRIVLRPPSADGGDEFTVRRDRRRLAGAGRQARALGPPDRLQQRRGGRVPRRPAQPARRRVAGCSSWARWRATPC